MNQIIEKVKIDFLEGQISLVKVVNIIRIAVLQVRVTYHNSKSNDSSYQDKLISKYINLRTRYFENRERFRLLEQRYKKLSCCSYGIDIEILGFKIERNKMLLEYQEEVINSFFSVIFRNTECIVAE